MVGMGLITIQSEAYGFGVYMGVGSCVAGCVVSALGQLRFGS